MKRDLHVLILDAGIAGLTLASALTQRGIRHVILEVASTLESQDLGNDGAHILRQRRVA